MKNTKTIFIVSLINLFLVAGAVVYLQNKPVVETAADSIPAAVPSPAPNTQQQTNQTTTQQKIEVTPSKVVAVPSATKTPGCLIVVDGIKYDLAPFVKLHSGGDIFQCGTDMSASFHDQHPSSYLGNMAKYKI